MGALSSTSPIQNAASSPTSPDLNDTKISVDQTPKPRKFFKSRNSAGAAEQIALQQQLAAQQQLNQSHNNHVPSSLDEQSITLQKQKGAGKKSSPKKEKIEKPKAEKPLKVKKEKQPKVPKVPKIPKEKPVKAESVTSGSEQVSPTSRKGRSAAEATRASNRVRGKCVNYNEDLGEEEFLIRTEKRVGPRHGMQLQTMTNEEPLDAESQHQEVSFHDESFDIPSSEPAQSQVAHPPIVLRISKVSIQNRCLRHNEKVCVPY